MSSKQGLILAVAAERLPASTLTTSFIPMSERELWSTLYEAGLWIGPRADLEEMSSYRQIIPYVALKIGDRFVKYTRTTSGGEQRLHGRVSIGLGGHIDFSDIVAAGDSIDLPRTLDAAARREVAEELAGVECTDHYWWGLLVDNGSSVGKVHIGVVACWNLRSVPHGSAEEAIGETGLTTIDELYRLDRDRLETWSSLLAEWLRLHPSMALSRTGELEAGPEVSPLNPTD
jgi:predicted NUDIX family phosphoesterase